MGPTPEVATVRRAVRDALTDLSKDDLLLVACSGGADSLALAAAAAFEAPRAGLRAGAVTVDHSLQPGSAQRSAGVARVMADLGLAPVEVLTVRVDGTGGPEAAARTARYVALDDAAARLEAVAVLLGHTQDDQAETVLLGLARGSGARSLAGMAPVNGLYRRPLLELDRSVVRAAAAGLPIWDDPHNYDPAYARSRLRHHAMGVLDQALGPRLPQALARTARLLRADADALDGWAQKAYDAAVDAEGGLEAAGLLDLPLAVRSRVLRRALLEAGCPATDLSAAHVAEVDRLVTDWHGQGPLHLPAGVRVTRRYGRLHFRRQLLGS